MTAAEAERLMNAAIESFWEETQGCFPEWLLVPPDVYEAWRWSPDVKHEGMDPESFAMLRFHGIKLVLDRQLTSVVPIRLKKNSDHFGGER